MKEPLKRKLVGGGLAKININEFARSTLVKMCFLHNIEKSYNLSGLIEKTW